LSRGTGRRYDHSEQRNNSEETLNIAGNGSETAGQRRCSFPELSAMSRNNGGTKLLTRGRFEMPVLSEQQRTFVTAYLNKGNASEAARQAGFNWPGQKGAKLLKTAKIRAAIFAELKPSLPLRRALVMAALAQLAYSNLGSILDEHGQPSVEKIREHGLLVKNYRARVIRSLSTDEVKVTDVYAEMYDRVQALRTIAKILGLFSSDSRVTQAKNDFLTHWTRLLSGSYRPRTGRQWWHSSGNDSITAVLRGDSPGN
jgi:phage terminase small subunit